MWQGILEAYINIWGKNVPLKVNFCNSIVEIQLLNNHLKTEKINASNWQNCRIWMPIEFWKVQSSKIVCVVFVKYNLMCKLIGHYLI